MAIITIPGRAGIAKSVKNNRSLFIAWGRGDEAWTGDEKVDEDPTRTELFREIGRRKVDNVQFVIGDEQGELATPTGRWRISETPTNNLYMTTEFDFADGNGYTIREFGLFINTIIREGLPEGQKYFVPEEIEDRGELLMLENYVPLIRTGDTRYKSSFVWSL